MAMTTIPLAIQDVTLTFEDDDSPKNTLGLTLTEGTITLIDGEYDVMIATDENGVPLAGTAPRQSGVRGMCGITLACKVFDAGDNASDANILDLCRWDGVVGSDWVSTTSSPDTVVKTVDAKVVVADRGLVKGATYAFPDVRLDGNLSIEASRDGGWLVNLTFMSTTTVKFTSTRTT